jgi:phosphoribosylaminoimidazole-succinocarboxamide synthase
VLAETYLRSGKVRDLYRLDGERLALVASDRISAFDVVLPTEISDKGRVLTGMSRFWFRETAWIIQNHLLDTDPADLVQAAGPGDGSVDQLRGRTMICRAARVLPVEAVVRGYLAGSGWKEYRETGRICGVALPTGLREGDRLPEPIFTPATKADLGAHDENITFDAMIDRLTDGSTTTDSGEAEGLAEQVRDIAIRLYAHASGVCERAGILLADTKFEFGLPDDPAGPDRLILVDEALTPDSSRFWDAATYAPGRPQPSFDKQFVRDWLETLDWDKTAPGPALAPDVVAGTRARYVEAYERITGASFARYLTEDVIAP